jgi:transcription elongation factor GreB
MFLTKCVVEIGKAVMCRAFVTEVQANQDRDEPPEPVQGRVPNYITRRGYAALARRVAALRAARCEADAIANAARRKRETDRIDRELRYFASRLESAIPVDQSHFCEHEVHFGSEVTVADGNGEIATYVIVGEDEADLAQGLISWTSPLASALTNARQGNVVTWKRSSGEKILEIVRVRNARLDEV